MLIPVIDAKYDENRENTHIKKLKKKTEIKLTNQFNGHNPSKNIQTNTFPTFQCTHTPII
jgi:hypothetical protein